MKKFELNNSNRMMTESEPEVEIVEIDEDESWETWKPTPAQIKYVRWMYNPDNLYNCKDCPENHGFSPWPETCKPCGQFRCWVAIHCKDVED